MSYTGCDTRTSPGKHQKGSSTPVSQSGQKKTRAMVAQSCENDEEALMCFKRTSSKRKLKKSGTDGSTNSDKAVYNAVCHAQSNDGQTNNRQVKWTAGEGNMSHRLYRDDCG